MYWLFYRKIPAGSSLELLIALLLFGIILHFSIPFLSISNSSKDSSMDPANRIVNFMKPGYKLFCPVEKSKEP